MSGYETEPGLAAFQAFCVLVFALAVGPWMTMSGLRVILEPSHVKKKSLMNWAIRRCTYHSSLARGNIRFWAWMAFLTGIGMDLLGVLMAVAIVGVIFRW